MSQDQYIDMCEQMGWEPDEKQMPKDPSLLSETVQQALILLNVLPDRWDGTSGSWFGKCGSARKDKFDHTWYEGIEACVSREAVTRDIAIRNNGKPIVWPSNTTRQGHVSQRHTTAYYDVDGGSNAVSAKANGSDTVATLGSYRSILLLVLVMISSYSS